LQNLIETYGQQAWLCRAVSVVRRDLPLNVDWESSRYALPDQRELYALYSELEFKTLLAKLPIPEDLPLFQSEARLTGSYRSYVHAVDPPEIAQLAAELGELPSDARLAFAHLD